MQLSEGSLKSLYGLVAALISSKAVVEWAGLITLTLVSLIVVLSYSVIYFVCVCDSVHAGVCACMRACLHACVCVCVCIA